jgi:hypothetical protein
MLRELLLWVKTFLALFSFIFAEVCDFYCNTHTSKVLTSSLPLISISYASAYPLTKLLSYVLAQVHVYTSVLFHVELSSPISMAKGHSHYCELACGLRWRPMMYSLSVDSNLIKIISTFKNNANPAVQKPVPTCTVPPA